MADRKHGGVTGGARFPSTPSPFQVWEKCDGTMISEPSERYTHRAAKPQPLSKMQMCAFPSAWLDGKLRVPRSTISLFASSSVPSRKRCTSSVGKQPFPCGYQDAARSDKKRRRLP